MHHVKSASMGVAHTHTHTQYNNTTFSQHHYSECWFFPRPVDFFGTDDATDWLVQTTRASHHRRTKTLLTTTHSIVITVCGFFFFISALIIDCFPNKRPNPANRIKMLHNLHLKHTQAGLKIAVVVSWWTNTFLECATRTLSPYRQTGRQTDKQNTRHHLHSMHKTREKAKRSICIWTNDEGEKCEQPPLRLWNRF